MCVLWVICLIVSIIDLIKIDSEASVRSKDLMKKCRLTWALQIAFRRDRKPET